ncbi:MAG TPA: FAD-dependent oxidoreductase, partial [Fimbriimonadaceae bacterium]|nr:FAD-dependent oxidoreductase [Fimbriimonadaceae bacterium]
TGELEEIEADDLILALGQDTDTGFLKGVGGVEVKEDGTVVVSPQMMTGAPGVFAGGDMVPSERTVTIAVGHGKKAARNIDAWLRGETYVKPRHTQPNGGMAARSNTGETTVPRIADFEKLHLWFYTEAMKRPQGHLEMLQRRTTFDEVLKGLSPSEASYEAKRCLSCGNCFECDGCYGACPEDAIVKLGPGLRYQYNYDLCTGCAICFEQCPCHAIELLPEEDFR